MGAYFPCAVAITSLALSQIPPHTPSTSCSNITSSFSLRISGAGTLSASFANTYYAHVGMHVQHALLANPPLNVCFIQNMYESMYQTSSCLAFFKALNRLRFSSHFFPLAMHPPPSQGRWAATAWTGAAVIFYGSLKKCIALKIFQLCNHPWLFLDADGLATAVTARLPACVVCFFVHKRKGSATKKKKEMKIYHSRLKAGKSKSASFPVCVSLWLTRKEVRAKI